MEGPGIEIGQERGATELGLFANYSGVYELNESYMKTTEGIIVIGVQKYVANEWSNTVKYY